MYNILSLDGGGSWAIIQLLTLKKRYGDLYGHEVLRHYDLVIANSGGSIILTALAENYKLSEALALFDQQEKREMIFYSNTFRNRFFPVDYLRLFSQFGPKYSAPKKKEAFEKLFPKVNGMQMDKVPTFIQKDALKIIVCTYDAMNNRAKFFRSFGTGPDYDSVTLTQAAHGSSNAPIQYFDFPARIKAKNTERFYELWDGALGGFNNPVAAGIIEAIKLGIPKEEIKVVSIGTGNTLMSVEAKKRFYRIRDITTRERRRKYAFWNLGPQFEFFFTSIMTQAKTILYQPPDWANYVAYMLLFGENHGDTSNLKRFVRLSPLIHTDENASHEDIELINTLYHLDMDLTKEEDIKRLHQCFLNWVDGKILNQPIDFTIMRNNNLTDVFGHKTFKEAMDDW